MSQHSSLKRSKHHLKHLVESVVAEEFKLPLRGLCFLVDEIEVRGAPPERLKVWATLHFLRMGSPFCCIEPSCHIPLFAEHLHRVSDAIRSRMGLRQNVLVEFMAVAPSPHAEVEFDNLFTARTPVDVYPNEINRRDMLGRTALMRAVVRGYNRQVEELLEAGADPSVVDCRGQNILEQVAGKRGWIATLLKEALARRALK